MGYHQPVCVETDVGPLHHYQRRGGVDNNNINKFTYFFKVSTAKSASFLLLARSKIVLRSSLNMKRFSG